MNIPVWILFLLVGLSSCCSNFTNCRQACQHLYEYNTDAITLLEEQRGTGPIELKANFEKAARIMKNYTGVITDDIYFMHMTIQYLCCYSLVQYLDYIEVVDKIDWDPLNVTFGKVICNRGGDGVSDFWSIVIILDEPSQTLMHKFVSQIEEKMMEAGIPVIDPRKDMEPFHTTLGVVDQNYPVQKVVEEINQMIPVWNAHPIEIEHFVTILPPFRFHSTNKIHHTR